MVTKADDLCVGCIAKFTDDVSCVFGRTLYNHDTPYGQAVCTPGVGELCVVVRDLDERDAFWHGTRQRCNNSYAPHEFVVVFYARACRTCFVNRKSLTRVV